MSRELERQFTNNSLHRLKWSDLGAYPFKALTTIGSEGDFRFFLPRILELLATDYWGSRYGVAAILGNAAMNAEDLAGIRAGSGEPVCVLDPN